MGFLGNVILLQISFVLSVINTFKNEILTYYNVITQLDQLTGAFIVGLLTCGGAPVYSGTKHGVRAFTQNQAVKGQILMYLLVVFSFILMHKPLNRSAWKIFIIFYTSNSIKVILFLLLGIS